MTSVETLTTARPLTSVQWLICAIAAIGFAFDSYELLMLPLIVRPALADLLGAPPNSLAVNEWVGTLQYVPAVAGGIFGLLGGYLTDLLGRRRVLVWSILLYALSALAAGYATSVGWLLFWRCCTFVGVCVEFVAAVAWLSELFPDARLRAPHFCTMIVFGPSCLIESRSELSKPRIRDVMPTIDVMPMTTPSTVSAERILLVRRVSHDIVTISRSRPVLIRAIRKNDCRFSIAGLLI